MHCKSNSPNDNCRREHKTRGNRAKMVLAAALWSALIVSPAVVRASEHITINVTPSSVIGAGFGELTPGYHDLRVTMNANGIGYGYSWAYDATGMTIWTVEGWSSSSLTYAGYGAQEDEMGWIGITGDISSDPMVPEYFTHGQRAFLGKPRRIGSLAPRP